MHNSYTKQQLKPIWLHCLKDIFEEAEKRHQNEIEISARDLQHRAKMKFPFFKYDKYRSTCWTMNKIMEIGIDEVIGGKIDSSTYTIKYRLPRIKLIDDKDILDTKYLSDNANRTKKINVGHYVSKDNNLKKIIISRPSCSEVNKYLENWKKMENYVLQENALKKLFTETYPNNVEIEDILIKVSSLNDFYSTNIKYPCLVAKHILNLKIDEKLNTNNHDIVNEIADVKINEGKSIYFFSFATKYCSHHKPDVYPIYDNYVDRVLRYFNKIDNFYDFKDNYFKDYRNFEKVLSLFQEIFDLNTFSLKEIDRYLWLLGKKYFPKKYKKGNNGKTIP